MKEIQDAMQPVFRLMDLLGRSAWPLLRFFVRALLARRGFTMFALCVMLIGVRFCGKDVELRLGTFNVREFGPDTDLERLTSILHEADRDVMALQEIQDLALLRDVAARLSARSGRPYQSVVSRCGGRSRMHVGFLYAADRLRLDGTREFPELRDDDGGSCSTGARAGLLATFSLRRLITRKRYALLVVHFPALGTPERAAERKMFWKRALTIAQDLREAQEDQVLLLGDVNSTGYLDNSHNERRDMHDAVERAGLRVLTPNLGCTAYYEPPGAARYVASHLDHIVGTASVEVKSAPRTLGFCAELRCAPTDRMPADFVAVSDHCPVIIDLY
jgi:endonuclease/exonuclease/phosphatase family metal-dependent hydrolase